MGGSLAKDGILRLAGEWHLGRKTGVLRLHRGGEEAILRFRQGAIARVEFHTRELRPAAAGKPGGVAARPAPPPAPQAGRPVGPLRDRLLRVLTWSEGSATGHEEPDTAQVESDPGLERQAREILIEAAARLESPIRSALEAGPPSQTAPDEPVRTRAGPPPEPRSVGETSPPAEPQVQTPAAEGAPALPPASPIESPPQLPASPADKGATDRWTEDLDQAEKALLANEWLRRAQHLMDAQKYWDAIRFVQATLPEVQEAKQRHNCQVLLARAYLKNEKWAHRAEEVLNEVLHEDPSHVEAHFVLGVLFKSRGLNHRADTFFRKVLALEPNHAEAQAELGQAHQRGLLGKLFGKE